MVILIGILLCVFYCDAEPTYYSTNASIYTCQSPKSIIIPQTIQVDFSYDDLYTPNVNGGEDKGLWMEFKGYDLMVNIDSCMTSYSNCTTSIEVTTDCRKSVTVSFLPTGNGHCSGSFYGRSGVSYIAKVIVSDDVCHLSVNTYGL